MGAVEKRERGLEEKWDTGHEKMADSVMKWGWFSEENRVEA